ncbi:MAG: zf-HC2 domain-containing protein [Thermoanaerobaculia bacterium]
MSDDTRWDEALSRFADAVQSSLPEHPAPELLVARQRGELSAEEAEVLDEHLAWCRECSDLFQGWEELAAGESEPVDPEERAADWAALRRRLADAPPSSEDDGGTEESGPSRAGTAVRVPRLAAGLAAALVMVVGAAVLWRALGPADGARRPGEPQANVPLVDLRPPGTDRSVGEEPTEIRLGASPVLILNTREPLEERRYRALVYDAGETRVWTVEGLEPTDFGNLTLRLPAGSLAPGRYRIELEPAGGGEVVERYPVRVVA